MKTKEEKNDYILICDFCNGLDSAFEELYHRYRKQLYGYLNNLMVAKQSEIDDIFSETWLKVIKNAHKYRNDDKFSAWLFRIARNLYLDSYRKSRSSNVVVSLDQEDCLDACGPVSEEPDYLINLSDVDDKITEVIETLATDQKETFLLRMEDFSFKEIAEIQSCSINTVLARMRYAVSNIKKYIQKAKLEEIKEK